MSLLLVHEHNHQLHTITKSLYTLGPYQTRNKFEQPYRATLLLNKVA